MYIVQLDLRLWRLALLSNLAAAGDEHAVATIKIKDFMAVLKTVSIKWVSAYAVW